MKKSHENAAFLLGRRIRSLREAKDWTQQELGNQADVNYKFLGEIERGQQNPSLNVLVKIASALEVDLPEMLRFEHEASDRKQIESQIEKILKTMPDAELRQVLLVLHTLFPAHTKAA
jgi:transcriptional regulator with XRE-family HTH domain